MKGGSKFNVSIQTQNKPLSLDTRNVAQSFLMQRRHPQVKNFFHDITNFKRPKKFMHINSFLLYNSLYQFTNNQNL